MPREIFYLGSRSLAANTGGVSAAPQHGIDDNHVLTSVDT